MGICSDIMHDFVLQEIKRIWSDYDGWKITPRKLGNRYDTIVLIDRVSNGNREIVKVLVTFNREVTPGMIDELIVPEKVNDGTIPRRSYAVVAPEHTDTSALPADITVYPMKSFAFQGKELVWTKKPVRNNSEVPTTSIH